MLILRSAVTNNAKGTSLFAFDKTGVDATGYGGSNPATTDFVSSILRIYQPDPVSLLPLTTYIDVNLYPTFPTGNKLTSFEITAASQQLTTWIDARSPFVKQSYAGS